MCNNFALPSLPLSLPLLHLPLQELASQLHAVVVSLEHRYYGASQPFADLSTEHLRYLSANQALADLANFHAFYEVGYGPWPPTARQRHSALVAVTGPSASAHSA